MLRVRRSAMIAAVIPVAVAMSLYIAGCDHDPTTHEIVDAAPAAADATDARLQITYPLEGTLFPPESVAPTFLWEDKTGNVDRWDVVVRDDTGHDVLRDAVDAPRWRPSEESWRQIKQQSSERNAEVLVAGTGRTAPATVLSSARVHIRTSTDKVDDALFYREVPLPFLTAMQDPSRIRWRFGT